MSEATAVRRPAVPSPQRERDAAGAALPFKAKTPMRRVSFYVPEPLYQDILNFAQERGDSMTGVLRWSLGVAKVIWDEVIKPGAKIQVIPSAESNTEQESQKMLVFGRY